MFEVHINMAKNRLYITLKGFMSDEEVRDAANEVIKNADKLRPGFDVVNDLSEMKVATQDGAKEIARAQHYLAGKGVNRVIRVVVNSVTKTQFNRTGKAAGYSKDADTASSVEEADKMLDENR